MAEAGDASEHEKINTLEAENPFPEGDARHQLWEPFWVEVRESLGPRIQELARRDEEVRDALHEYVKTPSEERPHLWEAADYSRRWLRGLPGRTARCRPPCSNRFKSCATRTRKVIERKRRRRGQDAIVGIWLLR
jgi:hypothetical protein